MNERIKELLHIATGKQSISENNLTIESVEKFAELIVKECVTKCKTDWYGDSLDDICDQMFKHFGVE